MAPQFHRYPHPLVTRWHTPEDRLQLSDLILVRYLFVASKAGCGGGWRAAALGQSAFVRAPSISACQ